MDTIEKAIKNLTDASSTQTQKKSIFNLSLDDVKVDGKSGSAAIKSTDLIFGSSTKSTQKLMNQMNSRGWTEFLIKDTVDNPYTIRVSMNKATGNSATVFYTEQGSYVIVDDVTKEIVQISDNINPSTWIPDTSIVNPYKPE